MAKRKLRPIRVEGNIAFVPLPGGGEAVIDATDAERIGVWNWFRHGRYVARWSQQGNVLLHREIMAPSGGMYVDHVSGNTLDNRRGNLRIATLSQNQHNARRRKDSTSGVKGVHWDKRRNLWRAQIRVGGKRKCLGYHDSLEAASAAYREASVVLHGDFARPE